MRVETKLADSRLLRASFLRGDVARVLAETFDGPLQEVKLEDLDVIVGALVAVGRTQEAEALYHHQEKVLTPYQWAACNCYLVQAYTRKADLGRARRFLGSLLRKRRDVAYAEVHYFSYYALAYHRFFMGRLGPARAAADRASLHAKKSKRYEWIYQSSELLSQIQMLMGSPIQALNLLKEATSASKALEHLYAPRSLAQQTAQLKARLNFDLQAAQADLQAAAQEIPATDLFSRLSLHLERARLFCAEGAFARAKNLLHDVYLDLIAQDNRRLRITHSLRTADMLSLSGDLVLALQVLELAEAQLVLAVDLLYQVEIFSRRLMIYEKLGLSSRAKKLKKKLKVKSLLSGASVDRMRPPEVRVTAKSNALNHRQINILQMLDTRQFIDVKTVRETFQVSEITAFRDLDDLVKTKLVERIGRARATKYRLRGRS
jgi:hypothetical protein